MVTVYRTLKKKQKKKIDKSREAQAERENNEVTVDVNSLCKDKKEKSIFFSKSLTWEEYFINIEEWFPFNVEMKIETTES